MPRRLARIVSVARDAIVTLASLTIIASQYSRLGDEPVFLITTSVSALLAALCAVDVALVVAKRGRGAQIGIGVFQLIAGLFWFALFPPVGLLILVPNVASLVGLREKKTPEELLRHPPVPRTRMYLAVVSVGSIVLLVSLFLPWFSANETTVPLKGATVSLLAVYSTIVAHTGGLPSVSIGPLGVAFALIALFCSPIAVVCGALGLRWRRLAFVSGFLAAAVGIGSAVSLSDSAGFGIYVMTAGGVVILIGFFALKGAKRLPR